jgi:hypothetical protein
MYMNINKACKPWYLCKPKCSQKHHKITISVRCWETLSFLQRLIENWSTVNIHQPQLHQINGRTKVWTICQNTAHSSSGLLKTIFILTIWIWMRQDSKAKYCFQYSKPLNLHGDVYEQCRPVILIWRKGVHSRLHAYPMCGIFCLPWHRHSGTRNLGVTSQSKDECRVSNPRCSDP